MVIGSTPAWAKESLGGLTTGGWGKLKNPSDTIGRVLVCGSRTWTDRLPIYTILDGLYVRNPSLVVIEGAAKGADSIAHDWAEVHIGKSERYPADWEKYGKAAGPIRNKQMLTEGRPDVVFAFAINLLESKGTLNMVMIAEEAGVPTYVIEKQEE